MERLEKKITWLEEQRKKDALHIDSMEERVKEIEQTIKSQSLQLKQSVAEVSRLSATNARINQFDDALVKQREDISRQLNNFEASRLKREEHLDEMRKSERDELNLDLMEMHKKIGEFSELQESLETRKHEEIRIAAVIAEIKGANDELSHFCDSINRKIRVQEDGRKLDIRKLNETQAEIEAVREKTESFIGMQESSSNQYNRLEDRVNKIWGSEGERREELSFWMEQQQSKLLSFERAWKEWQKKFSAFNDKTEHIENQIQSYQETYLSMRNVNSQMNDVIERLERRINEISEVQRINEERIRQEWSNFSSDDQKRLNTMRLTSDERWREHKREHEKRNSESLALDENIRGIEASIERLEVANNRYVKDMLAIVRDWGRDLEINSGS